MRIPNEFNGYSEDGRRLYFKGGDGGAAAAQQQEQDRQTRIKAATNVINSIFDSRSIKTGMNPAESFDPNQSYFDVDGNPVKIEKIALPNFSGSDSEDASPTQYVYDMQDINRRIANGLLFTGSTTLQPGMDRQKLYDDQKKAVYDINALDVNKQYKEAERQNRFGLARNGLLGGSTDIDSNAQLQEKTNEGLMKAGGIADQAASDLKVSDERARQGLISMAQSGIDTGTAQGMALRNLDATAQSAQATRQGASIGGLFNDLSQAYLMRQAAAGQRAGAQPGQQQWLGVSAPQQTYGGSTQR
jgi:hypothetical protein